jgi:hypothetical protein
MRARLLARGGDFCRITAPAAAAAASSPSVRSRVRVSYARRSVESAVRHESEHLASCSSVRCSVAFEYGVLS